MITFKQLVAELQARHYQCSDRTLNRWINLGLPKHQPAGPRGRRYFDLNEVEAWLRSRCIAPADGTQRPTTADRGAA